MNGTVQYIMMLVVMFGFMYFVMIRPQRKKQKQVQSMRSALKAGDKIITAGGFHGKVVKVNDDVLTVEMDPDKTKLKVNRSSIWEVKSNSSKLDKE